MRERKKSQWRFELYTKIIPDSTNGTIEELKLLRIHDDERRSNRSSHKTMSFHHDPLPAYEELFLQWTCERFASYGPCWMIDWGSCWLVRVFGVVVICSCCVIATIEFKSRKRWVWFCVRLQSDQHWILPSTSTKHAVERLSQFLDYQVFLIVYSVWVPPKSGSLQRLDVGRCWIAKNWKQFWCGFWLALKLEFTSK